MFDRRIPMAYSHHQPNLSRTIIVAGRSFGPFLRGSSLQQQPTPPLSSVSNQKSIAVGGDIILERKRHAGYHQAGDGNKLNIMTSAAKTQTTSIDFNSNETTTVSSGKDEEINARPLIGNNNLSSHNRAARAKEHQRTTATSQYKFLRRQYSMDQTQLSIHAVSPSAANSRLGRNNKNQRYDSVDVLLNDPEETLTPIKEDDPLIRREDEISARDKDISDKR